MKLPATAADYRRIEKAILFLEANFRRQPDLKEIARSANLSEYHFQRLFRRWAGISPKRFLQILTIEHAKKVMENSRSLLDVTYETGLSSGSRLHDLFVNIEAMTPGEFRTKGERLPIRYGFHPSPFGSCFLAVTERGICSLAFVEESDRKGVLADLKRQWHFADIREDSSATRPYLVKIFGPQTSKSPVALHVRGTNFQIKVWQALLKIPQGRVVSYGESASLIGRPTAVRAVANAVAHNPVAFLIPCHRVLRKSGALGGYRWGTPRKRAILAWEAGPEEGE